MTLLDDWYGAEKAARMRRAMPRPPAVVSPFGDAALDPLDRGTALVKMDAMIVKLKAGVIKARMAVAVQPSTATGILIQAASLFNPIIGYVLPTGSTPTEVKNSVLNGLNIIDNLIKLRLIDERENVLEGKLPLNKWLAAADAIAEGTASILRELNESGTAANLSAGFDDTRRDVADFFNRAKKILSQIPDALPALGVGGLVLAGVAAFVFWKVYVSGPAPRRMAAYSRRRRRIRL